MTVGPTNRRAGSGTHQFQPAGAAGVFDFYDSVYRLEDREDYAAAMGPAYETTAKGTPRTEVGKATYSRPTGGPSRCLTICRRG